MSGWHINSQQSAKYLYEHVLRGSQRAVTCFYPKRRAHVPLTRTRPYTRVLRHLAEALNDAGYDVKHPLNAEGKLDIPGRRSAAKEILFRPIIDVMWTKKSTTRFTKSELSEAVEILLGRIAEITGVTVHGLEGPQ